jgi:hypothetical protein
MTANADTMRVWLREKRLIDSKIDIFKVPLQLLCDGQFAVPEAQSQESTAKLVLPSMSAFKCRICKEVFQSHRLQQLHFKSDSHVNRLRATLSDADRTLGPPVSDDEASSSDDDLLDEEEETGDEEMAEEGVEEDAVTESVENIYAMPTPDATSSLEGNIIKKNTKSMGLQLIFQKRSFDFQFGVSAAIYGIGDQNEEDGDSSPWLVLARSLSFIQSNPYSCVICLQSGRFAAAVFCAMDVVVHKTFRRYTVRAKAGGAQSTHDKGGRKANSMGASLRRYGEQALREDVHSLLREWKRLLDACAIVLVAVPKAMRGRYIYNAEVRDFPLIKGDRRIRDVPFSIGKPTFEEVCLAHAKCMSVSFGEVNSVGEEEEEEEEGVAKSTEATSPSGAVDHKFKHLLGVIAEDAESVNYTSETSGDKSATAQTKYASALFLPEPMHTMLRGLDDACRSGDVAVFKSSLDALRLHMSAPARRTPDETSHPEGDAEGDVEDSHSLTVDDVLNTPLSIDSMATLLHVASEQGHAKMVYSLLQAGSSPSVMDTRGRYPYFLAKDKDTRDAFRR